MSRLPPLALAFHGVCNVSLRRDPRAVCLARRVAPASGTRAGPGATGWSASPSWPVSPCTAGRTDTPRSRSTTARGQPRDAGPAAARRRRAGDRVRRLGLARRGSPGCAVDADRDPRRAAGARRSRRDRRALDPARRLSSLAYERARADLEACKRELEAVVGPVRAPPIRTDGRAPTRFGPAATPGSRPLAAQRRGLVDDPHNLPRQDMLNRSSALGLRLKRADLYEPLMRFRPPVRHGRRRGPEGAGS